MTRRVMVYRRTADGAYLLGWADDPPLARFEPSRTTRTTAAALFDIGEHRGARRLVHDLWAGRRSDDVQRSIREALRRVAREIGDVCPALGDLLLTVATETDDTGRVVAVLPARATGIVLDTKNTPSALPREAFPANPETVTT